VNTIYRKIIVALVGIIWIQSFLWVPQGESADPPLFNVAATSAVLFDAKSGQVIFEQNAQQTVPPASLAKLMTLYLAYDAIKSGSVTLNDNVLISKKAWETKGSKMFIEVDKRVQFQKLLEGIASISGNDACIAVAEHMAGMEEVFVVKMNEKVKLLGLTQTQYANVSGLPADSQYTTASDMATLSYNYIKDHPEALPIHGIKQFTFSGITQPNRNGLLWLDEGVDGLKTGWISDEEGYHLVATAKKGDQRLIAVVMGARNQRTRENEALKLLTYGFKNFSTVTVLSQDEPIATIPVWKGSVNQVSLRAAEPGVVTVPAGEDQELTLRKTIPDRLSAPVPAGAEVGTAEILLKGKVLKVIPILAQDEVPSGTLSKRLYHLVLLSFITPPYWGWIVLLLLFLLVVLAGMAMRKSN
jgi:D-alanyl-D-alanine carboxypeptidase (penicillin-binding protein 5/6)